MLERRQGTPGWADDPVCRQDGRRWRGCRCRRVLPLPGGHQMAGGESGAGQEYLCNNKRRSLGFRGVTV